MPRVEIRFFEDERGHVPAFEWLERLRAEDRRAYSRCRASLRRLAEFGHELRRPHADYLKGGIHELRVRVERRQLRLLYFFHERVAVILIHALSKEDDIPEIDLARALARKELFDANPVGRTHERRWEDA